MATVMDRFGGIDVLINNAGITHRSAFADTRPGVFQQVMNVNFFGALYDRLMIRSLGGELER